MSFGVLRALFGVAGSEQRRSLKQGFVSVVVVQCGCAIETSSAAPGDAPLDLWQGRCTLGSMRQGVLRRRSRAAEDSLAPSEGARRGETDIFLSYSRLDREYVEWLHEGLVRRGKDVYVDWEDIPPWSPDYEAELEAAILASNAFVFVLSPDSVASPNCRHEVDVAAASGKWIRPVVWRSVENESVSPALRRPQWLDLSARDDDSVDELVSVLGVDPEWVQAHTRLLVRAQDWEGGGRDGSLLLRGSDLRTAEMWLGTQAAKEPPPTALQSEFIVASRSSATRRQRSAFGAVTFALAVTAGLAVFAFVQRSHAIQDAKVARSRELAALSLGAPNSDPRRSLELALRGVDEAKTPEAEDALRLALSFARSREVGSVANVVPLGAAFVRGSDHAVAVCADGTTRHLSEGVAAACPAKGHLAYVAAFFTPDGSRTFELGTRTSRVVDAATGAVLATIPAGEYRATRDAWGAIDANGGRLLTVGERGARLWAVRGHGQASLLRTLRSAGDSGALSPNGRLFATAERSGTIDVWTAGASKPVAELRGSHFDPQQLLIANDGTVAAGGLGGAALWTTWGRQRPLLFPKGGFIALTLDGRTFAVTLPSSGRVDVFDIARPPQELATFRAAGIPFFSPDGSRIVVTGAGVTLWQLRPPREVGVFGTTQNMAGGWISRDGRALITHGQDDLTLRLWRTSPVPLLETMPQDARAWYWRRPGRIALGPRRAAPRDTVVSADRELAATATKERILLWRVRDGTIVSSVSVPRASVDALSPSGQELAAVSADGSIGTWRTSDGEQLRRLPSQRVDRLVFSSAGDRLAAWASFTYGAELFDLDKGKRIPLRLPDTTSETAEVAFSPNGSLVAVARRDEVRLFHSGDGSLVRVLKGHPTPLDSEEGVLSATFSPDSRLLLTTGKDDTTRVWDVATGTERYVFRHAYNNATFSPDGAVFAGDDGRNVTLWSVASGKRLAVAQGGRPFGSFAFSPDSSALVAEIGDSVRLYGCDVCGSLERLRTLARMRLGKSK